MMVNPYLGQISQVGFNFAPRGWALCSGALLPISSNSALFSLLGTTFGGDGRTTFGLPDLRGRFATHVGTGPGLSHIAWGQRGGANDTLMTVLNMPSHTHDIHVTGALGNTSQAGGHTIAGSVAEQANPSSKGDLFYDASSVAFAHQLSSSTIANNGGGQPFYNTKPFLGLYTCIALTGVYPSRS